MTMPEDRWLDVDGVRTRYVDTGSGPTLLLVYGGNFGSPDSASSVTTWEPVINGLSDRFRVVAPDKLGQGHTGNPLRDEDYSMEAVSRHLARFMDVLDLRDVHLMGHSRGGFLVTQMALDFPSRVRSVSIINSSTLAPGVGLNEPVLAKPPHPSFTRESLRWTYEHYSYGTAHVTDEWVESGYQVLCLPKYRESCRKMEEERLKTRVFLPEMARGKRDLLSRLAEMGMQRPTQLIWTLNDPTARLDRGIALFELIARRERDTAFHVFNQAGHFPYREHPARFNEAVAAFIQGIVR
ncbi:alpha/beta fold hydrolase [Muricoccus radiodurans]|uniref:alpha/beta fold hydrolase n=1 Tax=Muricoccus radiodurans TaxID=2231721 RepID=UPI003CF4470D